MINKFFVEFKTITETFTLEFVVLDTPIAQRWFEKLKIAISYKNPIKENNRMYNFPTHNWNEKKIIDDINYSINKINSYKQFINLTAIVGGGQDHHNQLHKYFELLRGNIAYPNEYFRNAPNDIKHAIESLNISIHRLEDYTRNDAAKKSSSWARIVITFNHNPRQPFEPDDFDYFKTEFKFGDVHINYCEVGKSILDVFRDNDSVVGSDNILPHRYYAADLSIKLYNGIVRLDGFSDWWNAHESYFNSIGFFKGDKTLALGYLPVAKLINNLSQKDIISNLSKFNFVNNVYI